MKAISRYRYVSTNGTNIAWERDRYAKMFEALAKAECKRRRIKPDEIISKSGHEAWELVGYEAACKEMPELLK